MKRKLLLFLIFGCVLNLIVMEAIKAQNASNYSFMTSANIPLEDLSSGSTVIIGTGCDDCSTGQINLPFSFQFSGTNYTTFSANINGLVSLGTNVTGQFWGNLSLLSAYPNLVAFFADLATYQGNVRYKVVGSPGARKAVIEWNLVVYLGDGWNGDYYPLTFQTWLHEGSNTVSFVYGENALPNRYYNGIGIAKSSTDFLSVNLTNHTATANEVITGAGWPGSGRAYSFLPIPTSTIATSSIGSNYCPGNSININFTASGSFNSGNIFTAQLSDASGSFASPTSIGTIAGTGSGTINANVSSNTIAGTGYRIRVISSDPAVIGTDNGSNITINSLPTPTLSSSEADNIICAGDEITFTAGGGAEYEFFIDNVSQGAASSTNTFTTSSLTNGQSVTVKVTNAAGCIKSSNGIITTVNSLPVPTFASSDADNIICAGDAVNFTAGGGTNYTFYLNGVEVQAASSDNTWASSALNNLDAVKVVVTNAAGCSKESESIVTAVKSLPTAILSGGGTICPGGSANLSVALTGTGPWSVTYTDGTTPVTVSSISTSPHTIPVSPGSTKTYSLVSVSDANCNATSLSGTALVTVNSVPVLTVPVIASVGNDANICGASVTFAATATGDPTPVISYTLNGSPITSPHVFPVGTSTVTATATNTCGTDTETFAVTVTNDAPVLSAIIPGTINPVPINTLFSASATVTDNNLQSGSWTWDDGTTSAGVISGSTISGSRTYNATGVYTIGLEVKDACNSTDQDIYQYVVVYDPSGGFVTGGGWITSPKNAMLYYMQESGRANFGFVSKYVKGATKPTGETNFEFQTGNLHFQSSSYEWLVVSGATARYKGVGTINGSGNYGFILSAIDGQVTGGGGSDRFRIKIWDKNNNDVVVYDNNLSATGDDALAETIIGGGSIVVHEAKKATSGKTLVAATEPQGGNFYSYPTAFSTKTTIAFNLDRAEDYVLEVFDMKGALVKRLSAGAAEANKLYEVELDGTGMREGVYITRLSTSSNVRSLKTVLKR